MYINFNHNMRMLECWICGCPFALPEQRYLQAEDKGRGFHCPNGHLLGLGAGKIVELEKQVGELTLERTRCRLGLEAAARENERLLKRLDKKKKK